MEGKHHLPLSKESITSAALKSFRPFTRRQVYVHSIGKMENSGDLLPLDHYPDCSCTCHLLFFLQRCFVGPVIAMVRRTRVFYKCFSGDDEFRGAIEVCMQSIEKIYTVLYGKNRLVEKLNDHRSTDYADVRCHARVLGMLL